MRLFLAVDPSAEALAALAAAQEALRARLACRRWTDVAGAHVTLHFLGEVAEPDAAAIAAAMAEVARAHAPFGLALAPLGAFPSPARAHVLWAGLGGDVAALAALQGALGEALRALGHEPEARAYRPHLTLAREPRAPGEAARALAEVAVAPVAWVVGDVALYQSRLGPAGPRYEAVARHPLGH